MLSYVAEKQLINKIYEPTPSIISSAVSKHEAARYMRVFFEKLEAEVSSQNPGLMILPGPVWVHWCISV